MHNVRRATLDDLKVTVSLFDRYRAFYRCGAVGDESRTFVRQRLVNGDSAIFLAFADSGSQSHAIGFTQLYPLYSSTAMKRLWLLRSLRRRKLPTTQNRSGPAGCGSRTRKVDELARPHSRNRG